MKKNTINLCALLFLAVTAHAQQYTNGHWEEHPHLHTISTDLAKESAVMIEDNATIEYKDEGEKSWVYRTIHRTIKVLDDKGISDFNTMSIPVYPGQELVVLKARTILANGTVMDVSKDKMKESKGEDDNTTIVFALDGVEKNAEVEWMVCYKKQPMWYSSEMMQYTIPVVHASFDLSCPKRLKFEEKGYGGFPTAKDTVIADTRYLSADMSNIPPLHSEPYSHFEANRMKAEYKLSYQPEKNANIRIFTWQELAQNLYTNIYTLSDKEDKAVDKYLASIGVSQEGREEDKILKIENAIKSGITIYKGALDEDAQKLNNVISNKSASENSLIRLFAACFVKAGVNHELGLTTNQSDCSFDPDFESWGDLDKYLFYFPGSKKFISPVSPYIRYPFTETDAIGGKGLFCKITSIGDVKKVVTDIRAINPMPVAESHNDIIADISFSADMEARADVSYSFSGYCAMGIREAITLLPKDKVTELLKDIISVADKQEDIQSSTVSGEGFENYSTGTPLLIKASVKVPKLIEKAGPKYLFRIGDVIGKQSELYQAAERTQPIDLEYPHFLNRTITVNIPEGYTVLNPEAINMKAEFKNEQGLVTTAFTSDYKIDGKKLTVNISEFYGQLHFPITDFETFRKVINASADFNKVTLLLGKM